MNSIKIKFDYYPKRCYSFIKSKFINLTKGKTND